MKSVPQNEGVFVLNESKLFKSAQCDAARPNRRLVACGSKRARR